MPVLRKHDRDSKEHKRQPKPPTELEFPVDVLLILSHSYQLSTQNTGTLALRGSRGERRLSLAVKGNALAMTTSIRFDVALPSMGQECTPSGEGSARDHMMLNKTM